MCCKGSPTTFTSGFPQLDKYLAANMKKPANQYPGPVSSQINPLMTGAANMMSMYAGQGPYQAPGYNTYGSFMPQGQGQTQGQAPASGGGGQLEQMIRMMLGPGAGRGGPQRQ